MLGLLLIAGLCISLVLPHRRQGDAVHAALHHWGFDSMHQAASISRQLICLCQTLEVGAPLLAKLAPGRDGLVGSELACEAPAAIQGSPTGCYNKQKELGSAAPLTIGSKLCLLHDWQSTQSVKGTGMMLLASAFA